MCIRTIRTLTDELRMRYGRTTDTTSMRTSWKNQACFYLLPGSPEGDHNLHHVRVYVRACVTQFSLKLLQLHIFGKSQVLMNFFALQYFLGLVNFGPLLSE